ncbi:helix-turn-helix domain-containing protein [Methylobacter sp. sgz302048]|uniref:helix-turn-helix domain-containing protein n=1 Tax=Methylobacter sp. sgz302048 TaxID=3455945 RepID=UPI003F9FEDB7
MATNTQPRPTVHQVALALTELITSQEAAEYLGVTYKTLEVWRSTKRYHIPYIKVGRLVRYRKSDLEAFLLSRTQGGE